MRENLERVQRENLFGKTSRARVSDIFTVFKRRYLSDQRVLAALVTLVRDDATASTLDPICYFLAARADPLIADTVLHVLAPSRVCAEDVSHVLPACDPTCDSRHVNSA